MHQKIIDEFCLMVRVRRREMGITQEHLARLAGISRATVAAIDTSKIREIGLARAQRLLDTLALRLQLVSKSDLTDDASHAFDRALAISNRGMRRNLDTDRLKQALIAEVQLLDWADHLRALLDGAEIGLLCELVEELNQSQGVDKATLWKKIRALATKVGASGPYWK